MKLIHYILYPAMLGCVLVLSWICMEWERMYDELELTRHQPASIALRVQDKDVWLLIDERHLYRFSNACKASSAL